MRKVKFYVAREKKRGMKWNSLLPSVFLLFTRIEAKNCFSLYTNNNTLPSPQLVQYFFAVIMATCNY